MSLFFLCLSLLGGDYANVVKKVENGVNPSGPAALLSFEEQLRIGPDSGEDHSIWTGSGVTVEVDKEGHMYVADTGGNRILEFAADGAFLRKIGSKGEGPGEFLRLGSFTILDNGSAIAFENRGGASYFHFFDPDKNFVKRRSVNQDGQLLASGSFSADGALFGGAYVRPGGDGLFAIRVGVLSEQTQELKVLSSNNRSPFNPNRANDPNWWSEFLADRFSLATEDSGLVAFGPKHVFTALTNKYEITRWTSDMKADMVISRTYKPISQSEDEIQALIEPIREEVLGQLPPNLKELVSDAVVKRAIELAELSFRKQPIFGILPSEDGGFLVIHDYRPKSRQSTADIFSNQGLFLGQAQLPKIDVNIFAGLFGAAPRLVFKHGLAYAILADEDGELSLVRYVTKMKH